MEVKWINWWNYLNWNLIINCRKNCIYKVMDDYSRNETKWTNILSEKYFNFKIEKGIYSNHKLSIIHSQLIHPDSINRPKNTSNIFRSSIILKTIFQNSTTSSLATIVSIRLNSKIFVSIANEMVETFSVISARFSVPDSFLPFLSS